jgi:hypothetical protein
MWPVICILRAPKQERTGQKTPKTEQGIFPDEPLSTDFERKKWGLLLC